MNIDASAMIVLRLVAVVAAAVLVIRWGAEAGIRLPSLPKRSTGVTPADLRIVLDLAARLREAGKSDAVKLCQQLLDEMLKPEPKS